MVAFAHPLPEEMRLAQESAARIRREAFVDYLPQVCGIPIKPITLSSYGYLFALENGFVRPGALISAQDIAGFVWIHHADFGQFNAAGRKRVFRQVYRYLFPPWHRLNDMARNLRPIMPKWLGRLVTRMTRDTVTERFDAAGEGIGRLLKEAIDDYPMGDDNADSPPFAFQARIVRVLFAAFGIRAPEVMAMPMRRLSQFLRETIESGPGGSTALLTRREAEILAEDLKRRTDALKESPHV